MFLLFPAFSAYLSILAPFSNELRLGIALIGVIFHAQMKKKIDDVSDRHTESITVGLVIKQVYIFKSMMCRNDLKKWNIQCRQFPFNLKYILQYICRMLVAWWDI